MDELAAKLKAMLDSSGLTLEEQLKVLKELAIALESVEY